MNLKESGVYLRTIREAQQLTREQVAAKVGTSASQIERIENGKQETRSSVMLAILQAINGRSEDIQQLLLGDHIRVGDGKRLAEKQLALLQGGQPEEKGKSTWGNLLDEEQIEQVTEFLDSLSNDQLKALVEVIEQIQVDPERRKALLNILQLEPDTMTIMKVYHRARQSGQDLQKSKEEEDPVIPYPFAAETPV